MQEEIWKDIPNYEGLYQVSNFGRVKSIERKCWCGNGFRIKKEKILNPGFDKNGYRILILLKENIRYTAKVHQLVYKSFGNYIDNLDLIIDHKNNIKYDNRFDNLQQITIRENNTKDKWRKNKTSKYTGVCWHKKEQKWRAQIYIKGKMKYIGSYDSEIKASKAYNEALKNYLPI